MPNSNVNFENDLIFGRHIIAPRNTSSIPSSATMLVSLFLILITFFTVINSGMEMNAEKKNAALASVNIKFGKPSEDPIAFGGIVAPNVSVLALDIKKIFQGNAVIETDVRSEKLKIIFPKTFFFYSDEPELSPDKYAIVNKFSTAVNKESKGQKVKVSIVLGLEEYELDSQKLFNLQNAIGLPTSEIGFDQNAGDHIYIYVEYD